MGSSVPPKYMMPSTPYGSSPAANTVIPSQPQNPQVPQAPQMPQSSQPQQSPIIPQTLNPFRTGGRFFAFLALLLLPFSAKATTTFTGTIQNLNTGSTTTGTYVRFYLRGCGGNQPRVSGVAVIAPTLGNTFYFDFVANGSGAVSGTLYSTRDSTGLLGGDITCGTSTTSVFYGMQIFVNGKGGPEVPIHAKNGVAFDISTVTLLTTTPVSPALTPLCPVSGGILYQNVAVTCNANLTYNAGTSTVTNNGPLIANSCGFGSPLSSFTAASQTLLSVWYVGAPLCTFKNQTTSSGVAAPPAMSLIESSGTGAEFVGGISYSVGTQPGGTTNTFGQTGFYGWVLQNGNGVNSALTGTVGRFSAQGNGTIPLAVGVRSLGDIGNGTSTGTVTTAVGMYAAEMHVYPGETVHNKFGFSSFDLNNLGTQAADTLNAVFYSGVQTPCSTCWDFYGFNKSQFGSITFPGTSTGSASLGVAAAAGTPNQILLPTSTGSSAQFLQTNGANPQQTSWSTVPAASITPGTNGQCVITSGGGSTWGSCAGTAGVQLLSVNTTPVSVNASTTAAQNLQAFTFNAGVLNSLNKTFRVTSFGGFTLNTLAEQVTLAFSAIGSAGDDIAFANVSTLAVTTNTWKSTYICTVTATGASGTLLCESEGYIVPNGVSNFGSPTSMVLGPINSTTALTSHTTVNLTSTVTVQTTITFNAASTSNVGTGYYMLVELLN